MYFLLCLAAFTAGMYLPHHLFGVLGTVGAIGVFLGIGWQLCLLLHLPTSVYNTSTTALASGLLALSVQSLVYIFFATTKEIALLVPVLLYILARGAVLYKKQHTHLPLPLRQPHHSMRSTRKMGMTLVFTCITLMQGLFLFVAISRMTITVLPSPWIILGHRFFFLYGVMILTTLLYLQKERRTLYASITLVLALLSSFSLTAILYPLGYGYDPFLHRAAQAAILDHGTVLPKTPFYIGQYVLVSLLAHVTHLPIKLLDIWLVPVLSSTLLPFSLFAGFRYGWKMKATIARTMTLVSLLVFPISVLIATTPHNLATVFLLSTIGFSLGTPPRNIRLLALLSALTSLSVHPFVGVFAVSIVIMAYIHTNIRSLITSRILQTLLFILTALSIPLLFLIYQLFILGQPFPGLSGIYLRAAEFLVYFKDPYYFLQTPASLFWESLYTYRKMLPLVLAIGTCIAALHIQKRTHSLLLLSTSMLIGSYLVTTILIFPELRTQEAQQYGGRLLLLGAYTLTPLAGAGIILGIIKLSGRVRWLYLPAYILLATMLTTSLYFLYPQTNPKVYHRGFNVTYADYSVSDEIEAARTRGSIAVLAPSITAAAAIERYGFSDYLTIEDGTLQFFYAIPSGSFFAKQFLAFIYDDPALSIERVFANAPVDHIYVYIPAYWDRYDAIVAQGRATADAHKVIGANMGTLFIYARPTAEAHDTRHIPQEDATDTAPESSR